MKEHPKWLPSWLGYAQFGDKILICADRDLARGGRAIFHGQRPSKYDVTIGPEPCQLPDECENPGVPHGRTLWSGDDRAEAELAFEAAQVELLRSIERDEV